MTRTPNTPPNVLFVMTDQWNPVYGDDSVEPSLAEFSARSCGLRGPTARLWVRRCSHR